LYPEKDVRGTVVRAGFPDRFGWRDELPRVRSRRRKKTMRRQNPRKFQTWRKKEVRAWTWDWPYQEYLFERLARVTSGECRRLMIFMPPRHGKSETVTFRYTAWRLLRDPSLNVIIGSYNQRLANKASRRIQRIFQDERSRTTGRGG